MSEVAAESASLPVRLRRVLGILACPTCNGGLSSSHDALGCDRCGKTYSIRGGKIFFTGSSNPTDPVDKVKENVRRTIGNWYYRIAWLISPCMFMPYRRQALRAMGAHPGIVVDLGSGDLRLSDEHICVDCNPYPEVDIVCDITHLPFKDNSVDGYISNGVLEHIAEAPLVVAGIARTTKVGGKGFHHIPFLFPFHASPHDYTRWTSVGVHKLFSPFSNVCVENASGPVSYLLLGIAEALSIILSFGHESLKGLVYPLVCAVLFPLKFVDLLFIGRPSFLTMSPLFSVRTRKG